MDHLFGIHTSNTTYYTSTKWIEISTGNKIKPGNGLSELGNTWNVNIDSSSIDFTGSNQLEIKENFTEDFSLEKPKDMCHYTCSELNTTNIIIVILIIILNQFFFKYFY